MKIAIPSDEGTYLSQHFGRTLGFKIFEISEGRIVGEEYRQNNFTGHAMGHSHDHEHDHEHDHHHHGGSDGHAQHSHNRILTALSDCEVVIAGGMGRRLFDDLTENGKQIFITTQPETRKAVELFLASELASDKKTCSHHD